MTRILGIVNVTRDSFSDGGRYLDPERALARARELLAAGADGIDLGAESTHPDSEDVSAEEEIRRLASLVDALVLEGVSVSVDTVKPSVMRAMIARGASYLNDVHGMRDPESVAVAAECSAELIVMFSRAAGPRAERVADSADGVLDEIRAFFADRVRVLTAAGVERRRIIADPGMGFFLGTAPEPSLRVLGNLGRLRRELELPLLVSVSRKSFLGAVTRVEVEDRGPATLAAEVWAHLQGVDYLRTHDVGQLVDALRVVDSIRREQEADQGDRSE